MEHFSLDFFQPKKKKKKERKKEKKKPDNFKAFKRIMIKEPDLHLISFELETMIGEILSVLRELNVLFCTS